MKIKSCAEQDNVKRDASVGDLLAQTGLSSTGLQLDYSSDKTTMTFVFSRNFTTRSQDKFSELSQIRAKIAIYNDAIRFALAPFW